MTDQNTPKKRSLFKPFLLALILIVVLVIAWHLIFPLLGLSLVVTGSAWWTIVSTIFLLCVAILLFFVFTGLAVALICLFGFVWIILAIGFFPILFPVLVPLFIIMCFIAYVRRK